MAKQLKDLNVGDKVKFGRHQINNEDPQEITWKIAAKDQPGYPGNSITLITDKIIDIRGFDAKEPNNSDSDRRSYGNNRYRDSNLRQWLNKSGHPWLGKTHNADEPPTDAGTDNHGTGYDNRPGFLTHFTDEEVAAILETTLTVAKNTVTDGGGTESVVDKIFLASVTEVGLANEPGGAEGTKFPIFSNDNSRIGIVTKQVEDFSNYDITGARRWWLRSPFSSSSHYERIVSASGALNYYGAFYGYNGVRPLCNLKSEILVSEEPDSDGAYILSFAPPHKILFQEGDEFQVYFENAWNTVGQAGDDLDNIFEDFGMKSLSGIDIADLEHRKMLVKKDGEPPRVNFKAVPYPQLILPTGDIVLKMLDKIHHFKIYANQVSGGKIRIVFSVDGGEIWQTYRPDAQEFEEIDINNMEDVKENGITPDTFNSINEKWNEAVESQIRFAYYIEQESTSCVAEVDKLEVRMDLQGRWKKAKHDTDYDYEYDNEHIYVSFATDGSYKVNYQG